jgi:RNA polymerase sigma factor (sigma-70 family)
MADPNAESGLEIVLQTNRPKLLSFAARCGAGDDAEDVLQECWMRIRSVDRPIADPWAYIHRIIYNIILDRRRGALRTSNREREWDATMSERDARPGSAPDAERAMLAREAIEAANARLTRLGEPTLTIFIRHRLRGEVQSAIARDLGMGVSTIEKHLRRAYHALLELRDPHDEV